MRDFLEKLVRNPLGTDIITGTEFTALLAGLQAASPSWYHTIFGPSADKPTCLFDEGDGIQLTPRIRSIMNSGHNIRGRILVGGQSISTFAPFAMFRIGPHPERTLISRSIEIELRKKDPGQKVKKARRANVHFRGLEYVLKAKIERFVDNHKDDFRQWVGQSEEEMNIPDEIDNRAADNWEPLLAIADVVGGHWPETARRICREFAPLEAVRSYPPGAGPRPQAQPSYRSAHSDPAWVKRRLLEILADGPQSVRELHASFSRNLTAAVLSQALAELEAEGKITSEMVRSGGRPKQVWRLVDRRN